MASADAIGHEKLTIQDNQGWDERVLAVSSGDTVTVFIVLGERYTVIVDTLYSTAGAGQLADIARHYGQQRAQRFNRPSGSLLVVNTHSHWDHAWGNHLFAGIKAPFPAPIIATLACRDNLLSLDSQAELESSLSGDYPRFDGAALTAPTICVKAATCIDCGDLTLELIPAPGHSCDQLVVWIPEISVLLAADASEYPWPFVQDHQSLATMQKTLQVLHQLQPAWVLACHNSSGELHSLIDDNLAYFAKIYQATQKVQLSYRQLLACSQAELESLPGLAMAEYAPGLRTELVQFYYPGHRDAILASAWLIDSCTGGERIMDDVCTDVRR